MSSAPIRARTESEASETIVEPYLQDEKKAIEKALREGRAPRCPRCREGLDVRPVPRPPAVSYVRHRSLVTCPRCGCHAALDHA